MKNILTCLLTYLTLMTVTAADSTVEKVAIIKSRFHDELVIMANCRANPNKPKDPTDGERVLVAARKFFSKVDLLGLDRSEVEALLGKSTRQFYGNGEIFVIREIVYDSSNKVIQVKELKSE